jgi:hypothetical protein
MESEGRTESLQIVVGAVVLVATVVAGATYGRAGSAAVYVIVVFYVTVGIPVAVWFFRRRAKRAILRAVAEFLKLKLEDARTQSAAEKESSDQVWLAPARQGERSRLLDLFEASFEEARRTGNLKAREEKLDRALEAYLVYLVCVQLHKVDDIDQAAQGALVANEEGRGTYPADPLKRMLELTTSVRRELEATKPRPRGFVEPGDKALQRSREPLAEAVAIAERIGLLDGSPALEPTMGKADEELLLSMGKLLQATRRLDDD